MTFTAAEKLACVDRELKMRLRVYARMVSIGKMKPETAAKELALMEAIVADYQSAAEKERLL